VDPLTQGLLGASFGQALYGRALGRRALVWLRGKYKAYTDFRQQVVALVWRN